MQIQLDVDGILATATLDDNETSRDFVARLPLTLTLEDYNATEKISTPPDRLSTEGAPEGFRPSAGDVAHYARWGNLAIFYRGFGYSPGLVQLGRVESRADLFGHPGLLRVTIQRTDA